MGVSDKSTGDTISFSDINDELGNSSTATLDMKTAGDSFDGINTDGVYSITEFYGVSDASPAFSSFTAAGNASTTGRIDISWGTSGPVNTFSLKRATSVDGDGDLDENISIISTDNDASHTDTGLSNSGTNAGIYHYQATAVNTDPNPNNSTNSSVVSATLLPTVTSPSATANTGIGGRIDLAWTNNGTITQVVVKRATNSGMSAGLATILTDTSAAFATTFADTGQTGQKYYQIHITNATGTTLSSVVNATATSAIARTIGTNWGWTWDGDSYDLEGWSTSQLIECVENTDPLAGADPPTFDPIADDGLSGPSQGTNALTTTLGGWNNSSVAKLQSNTSTVFDGGARFWRNDTDSKIHQIAANGVISNTISYTPVALVLTEVSKTTSQVVVRATGDTRVAKTLKFFKDGSLIATKTDHTKGSSGNTSVTYDFTFTGLASSTTFAFKVNSSNAEASSGTDSNTLSVTTSGGATNWSSVPADFNLHLTTENNASDELLSGALTINLANGTGNTTISCAQPSGTPSLEVAVSTSSDPGSGGSFATSQTVAAATTYYLRFKLVEGGVNNDLTAVNRTITFTNNSVSNTTLDINCKIINILR
tara:strand:+ start:3046 stop:4839 length:1794 start_codon:yes stop_codon:yes gene_type:complete